MSDETLAERLRDIVKCYTQMYPAFRSRPIGADYSLAREEQNAQIGLEDRVLISLAKVQP